MYTAKVEEARAATEKRPSAGPVYRCIYAKNGLTGVPDAIHSPWDLFRFIYVLEFLARSTSIYVNA